MTQNGNRSFELEMTVPFYDVDSLQVVWHGHYLKYMDDARSALFDSLGADLPAYFEKTGYIFPVTKTSVKHIHPLRYKDRVICKATLVEAKFKIVVDFEIRLQGDAKICARGRTEQVAVKAPEMEMQLKIPDEIRNILEGQGV